MPLKKLAKNAVKKAVVKTVLKNKAVKKEVKTRVKNKMNKRPVVTASIVPDTPTATRVNFIAPVQARAVRQGVVVARQRRLRK